MAKTSKKIAKAASVKAASKKMPAKPKAKKLPMMQVAINALWKATPETALSRYEVQNMTGMSRLLSRWDMERLAKNEGAKLWVGPGGEDRGAIYCFVGKKAAAPKKAGVTVNITGTRLAAAALKAGIVKPAKKSA